MTQKIRVFKLAHKFGIENEVMVNQVLDMGIEIRNYMSTLSTEEAGRVSRHLEKEREKNTVEEHIRPTVIRRRMKDGAPSKPVRRRLPKVEPKPVDETKVIPAPVPEEASTEAPLTVAADPVSSPVSEEPPDLAVEEDVKEEENERAAVETATRPIILRPSSEAPVIRRRIPTVPQTMPPRTSATKIVPNLEPLPPVQQAGRRGKTAPQRRREVESRDIAPSGRFTGVGSGKFGSFPPGRKRRMAPGKKGKKTEITTPKAIKRVIRIEEQITLHELGRRMGVKATELLTHLIGMGMGGVNINSTLDADTAKLIASEFDYEVEDVAMGEDDLLSHARPETEEDKKNRIPRPPVVTMMGHVDHGKTSLLDMIRKSDAVSGEAGGITQHIGAYRAKTSQGMIAFIDTPGHEAFTAMRARGADITDIVVLVTAADDGVMPQTIEALNHARAAKVPVIVAINKCDLPTADPERTRRMLLEHNLVPEELGGDTIMCEVSAKTGDGIEKLLEMLSLQSEMMELNANPSLPGRGIVLEAYLDRGRGPVANILVQDGTIKIGDVLVAGPAHGKIRAMTDEHGRKLKEATPSTPVEVLGLSSVPNASDLFDVISDMKLAEKVARSRSDKQRASMVGQARPSLEALYEQMQKGEQANLNVIIKADMQGSLEAISDSIRKQSTEKVKVSVVHSSVGGITESDVLLASTSGAIIVGFNIRPTGKARKIAEEQNVEILLFSIIYELIEAVEQAMLGLLSPTKEEKIIGQVEVRNTFKIPKVGMIAGSYVTDGKIIRNSLARLIRDSVQIWEGRVGSLRRFKDDVKEVAGGFECGVSLDGYNDIKVGDVIEIYIEKEVEATLS